LSVMFPMSSSSCSLSLLINVNGNPETFGSPLSRSWRIFRLSGRTCDRSCSACSDKCDSEKGLKISVFTYPKGKEQGGSRETHKSWDPKCILGASARLTLSVASKQYLCASLAVEIARRFLNFFRKTGVFPWSIKRDGGRIAAD
jgi:hypothetical protein